MNAQLESPEPLFRFPGLHTSNTDEWEQFIVRDFGGREIHSAERNATFRVNRVQVGNMMLGYSRVPESTVTYDEANVARLAFVTRGHAVVTTQNKHGSTRQDSVSVLSPNQAFTAEYSGDLEMLQLRFDADRLHQRISALTGYPARQKLELLPIEFAKPEMITGMRVMVDSLVRVLELERGVISPVALTELGEALALQYLSACRHNYSELLASDSEKQIPQRVRRAAEYIDAHWHDALSVEKLAEISGASVRTLFAAFSKAYGVTPMVFVKRKRLEEARRMLISDTARSVTAIAYKCGFLNSSHFARDYLQHFGELPSQTLKNGARA